MKTKYINFMLLSLLLSSGNLLSQQYFKLLENPEKSYHKKITRFPNGDILLGDSPLTVENGAVVLSKLDQCGNELWTRSYQWKQNYLTFKDFEINELGEIFILGSAYEGFDELIFLLKLDKNGKVIRFRLFNSGTVDHFTYSIDLQGNKILAYGLLLGWRTQKQSFVAIFDEKLNYINGTSFTPFESDGDAIITKDGGFLCRSGIYLIKLDKQYNLEWATSLEGSTGLFPILGPVEVEGGYLFEFYNGDHAFFYKIDTKGNLVWTSDQFPSTSYAADIQVLSDGRLLATYNAPDQNENYVSLLLLSAQGKILEQRKLNISQTLHTGFIYQSINKKRIINIIGNQDLYANDAGNNFGFLMQFSLDSLSGECFDWQGFHSVTPNERDIKFNPQDITFFDLAITNVQEFAEVKSDTLSFSFKEVCDSIPNNIIHIDTTLLCGESWRVSLPGTAFIWEDEVKENPRTLEKPGIYRASDHNCILPTTYEFTLQREPCECNIYLPTAFSPNYDGQNDRLELFSNCTFQYLQLTIYNRWGDKVFESNDPEVHWNGLFRQKPAEAGIYVAMVRYQLLNESNEIEENSIVQNIMLLR
ncbi:MAG: gliding motility-associated C-terminal domain-containing protein [Saprospiraceae bacterium]|nr:gliding motility-associated C-terminal domain-containing protein [Saprospiraceae bacterium]